MSGLSGGFLTALFVYTLILGGVCALMNLSTRMIFKGLALVFVTVSLSFVLTVVGYASGMAEHDFSFWMTLPFLFGGVLIAAIWQAILLKKARANG